MILYIPLLENRQEVSFRIFVMLSNDFQKNHHKIPILSMLCTLFLEGLYKGPIKDRPVLLQKFKMCHLEVGRGILGEKLRIKSTFVMRTNKFTRNSSIVIRGG